MFGYVNDIVKHAERDEKKRYRSYYCRVCNALSLRYGFRYRALVNYDVVIYMIITKLAVNDSFYCYNHHCQACHCGTKKNFKDDKLGQVFASLTALGMAVAVKDKLQDGSKNKYKFFSRHFKKAFCPTDQKEKQIFEKTFARLEELFKLEKQNIPDAGLYCNFYADSILDFVEQHYSNVGEPYKQLIRQIAFFTNYMDMLQDYDDDYKTNSFNPLKKQGYPTLKEYLGRYWQEVRKQTNQMCSLLNDALDAIRPQEECLEWEILAKLVKIVVPQTIKKIVEGKSKRNTLSPMD